MKKKTFKLLALLLMMLYLTSNIVAQNDDCDCPEPTENDGVCVTFDFSCGDSTISIQDTIWMPSECEALCYGFTQDDIIGNCTWEDVYGPIDTTWTDCNCPEPLESDGVCIVIDEYQDSTLTTKDTIWMPSECLALCSGFTLNDIIGNCTWEDVYGPIDTIWTECDCPDPMESEGVCVLFSNPQDSTQTIQDTIWMPSECEALCYGFTQDDIIGNCTWEDVYGPIDTTWTDCDCPEPMESDGVCVLFSNPQDSTQTIQDTIWMPSECEALCYGFTQDDIIGNCTWEDVYGPIDTTWTECDCPDPMESEGVCVLFSNPQDSTNTVQDTFWMPSECIALCFGFTQDQILGNCDSESNDSYFSVTKTTEPVTETNITLYPNPVNDNFTLEVYSLKSNSFTTTISGIDGRIVYSKEYDNKSKIEINASTFKAGIYFINIRTNKINKVLRMVKL